MTFFKIFSRKKEKQDEKIEVIIDHREKNSLMPSELIKLNFKIQFQQLPLGDYIVKNTIIERKTFQDLQSSIINKRIFKQLKDLPKDNSLLIIEGSDKIFIHENALRGFLLSLATEYKIPFIFSKNESDTARYLLLLAKKEKKETSLRQFRTLMSKSENQQFILEGFPNIGPKTAKKLLEHFKSLSNIFNASEEELQPILKSKTQSFKSILG